MAGVPGFIADLGWGAIFAFLTVVVFTRAQGTYWLGRWARKGADATAARPDGRASRVARRLSGPQAESARRFIERWGFVGIPVSFLTIGFQTMVNAMAGYIRMRWDLYTAVMIPGCLAWAAIYATATLTLFDAFKRSPWLGVLALAGLIGLGFLATKLRRSDESSARTPQ